MPPKNPAFVQENVRRAAVAWRELGERLTDPADRERLRILKLAIHDLDDLQAELHALLGGLAENTRARNELGDGLLLEAETRCELALAKGEPA